MRQYSAKLAIFLCIIFIILAYAIVSSPKEGFTPRFIREKKNYTLRKLRGIYQPYYRQFTNIVNRLKRQVL